MTAGPARVPIPEHPGFWRRGRTVCFKYRDNRGRQRWGSAATLKAAKLRRQELEVDVRRGEYRPRSRVTFEEYALGWVETYQGRTSKRIEESTRRDYRARLEQEAIPFFASMPLAAIEPRDVKAYAAHVASRARRRELRKGVPDRRPVSENTVRLALAPVKALLATAFEDGVIRVNPAANVRILVARAPVVDEVEVERVKALSEPDLAKVLAAIPDRWRLFFVVLAHLGLRIGEVVELRWRDVDLGARTVHIRRSFYEGRVGQPKSQYGRRRLRLTPAIAAALWDLRKETRAGDGELVFTSTTGTRVDASNVMARVLKPAARTAGVGGWVGFHTFRHTCATALFRRGWNAKQVQLWLGHHKASFTVDTYVHLLDEDLPDPPSIGAAGTWTGTQSTPGHTKPAEVVEAAIGL